MVAQPPGPADDAVLVVNAGSSSVKAALFAVDSGRPVLLRRAEVAGIRKQASLVTVEASGEPVAHLLPAVRTHRDAMGPILDWVADQAGGRRLLAVGHRIVHGGSRYQAPTPATGEVLDDLATLVPLAPVHQSVGLDAVRAVTSVDAALPQVLCFDTAFHATLPPVARTYALPRDLVDGGIRRYGFHGLSYEYIAEELPGYLGPAADGRVVVAHLGSGSSLCALWQRSSIATTMGMTTLDGVPMGTRCGALDPGVVLHLLGERRMTVEQVTDLLHNQAGLFGLSGLSGRMEFLLHSGVPAAAEAVDLFVYRVAQEVAAMASALGGLDAVVFTAGIGENSAPIRARVAAACSWMGLALDDLANDAGGPRLTVAGSRVSAWVIPTDEAVMIARHTVRAMARA